MSHDTSPFAVGAIVRVTDGPFDGLDGVVEEAVDGNFRVAVTFFGRPVPILVEPQQIAPSH
jgi:transcriptional antiterminator NusG